MGNICQLDSSCFQVPPRQTLRNRSRSNSDNPQNLSLKNFIQMKKCKITQQYVLDELLGNGSYGKVYKATNIITKVPRAVKMIDKKKQTLQNLEQSFLLKKLDHPNIIRIYQCFIEERNIYLVMDFCQGGQLFQRIIKQGHLSENQARNYMKQLLSAIYHCHMNNIMHRDLKPQNIMFIDHNKEDLKIIDFGVGTFFNETKIKTLKVGSIYYMAPEVIKKKYNHKCDIWSLGVILYILLTGTPPFIAKTDKDISELILKGNVEYNQDIWKNISSSAKQLVQKMLTYNPDERINAKDALNHPWIKMSYSKGGQQLFLANQLSKIKKFTEMNRFQSALMVYISHNFIQNQLIKDFQTKFKQVDSNGDGKISRKQFQQCYNEYMPPIKSKEIKEIFIKLDKNNSGYIDYSQFISSTIDSHYIQNQNLVQKAFQMIDKNGNGLLQKKELMNAFCGFNQEACEQLIKEFDLNNDGKISKSQFKLAMKGFLK